MQLFWPGVESPLGNFISSEKLFLTIRYIHTYTHIYINWFNVMSHPEDFINFSIMEI